MSKQQEPNRRVSQPLAEPEYQLQRAMTRLEAALESMDLDSESERAEAVITALRAADYACKQESAVAEDRPERQ